MDFPASRTFQSGCSSVLQSVRPVYQPWSLVRGGPDYIPLMFIATDEKVRMSRLATIFPVVAEYFLTRSVAKKASRAGTLSRASNSRKWFGTRQRDQPPKCE